MAACNGEDFLNERAREVVTSSSTRRTQQPSAKRQRSGEGGGGGGERHVKSKVTATADGKGSATLPRDVKAQQQRRKAGLFSSSSERKAKTGLFAFSDASDDKRGTSAQRLPLPQPENSDDDDGDPQIRTTQSVSASEGEEEWLRSLKAEDRAAYLAGKDSAAATDPNGSLNDLQPAIVPSCFEDDEWLHDMEKEYKDVDWCYMCNHKQEPGEGDDNPFYQKLEDTFVQNFGTMKEDTLCKLVQDLYNEKCRPFVDDQPEWGLRTIYWHFLKHSTRDEIVNRVVKRTYQQSMMLILKTSLVELETATGARRLNTKAMKMFLDLDKRRQSLVMTTAVAGNIAAGGTGGGGAPLTSSRSAVRF
jgi:hypothetical protein